MTTSVPYFIQNITYYLQLAVYDMHRGMSTIGHHTSVIWLIGALLTPIITAIMLFFAGDFMQIVRLQISFSSFMGDLFRFLVVLVVGFAAEVFFLYKLFVYFFH